MGLIKAAMSSVGSTFADQWKEYFICESMPGDVLAVKGQKKTSSRSSNTKGSDNIISNGSGIVVADGQCMIIVDDGKVAEVCAEPGRFTYNSSTEPSLFTGKLGTAILDTFKTMGKRFTYGGDTAHDQRVYYINTKVILDNKFGTPNPVPFRVVDSRVGIDIDVSVRCSGVYSYRIVDPILFYRNIMGNVSSEYRRSNLDNQLKTEFISALQPAFGRLSEKEMRPNQIVSHTTDLENAMNEALSQKWAETRGIKVASVSIGSLTLPEEDQELIKNAQLLSNPTMAAATLAGAQAAAMKAAASNTNGAVNGFMGMGMAQNMGMGNMQNLYAMGQQATPVQHKAPEAPKAPAAGSWKCSCGAENTGKFCAECGSPKPAEKKTWKCSCGAVNTGKFCPECGSRKPEAYKCSSCGFVPADPTKPPKFCPECGNAFGPEDLA